MKEKVVRAYECNVKNAEWPGTVIHALTAGKARYQYWLDVHDCYPDIKIMDIVVHSLGARMTPSRQRKYEQFAHTAEYRGVPFAKIGMKVRFTDDGSEGVIVDRNNSANFDILFTKGRHEGLTLNCHPNWKIQYLDDLGNVIKEFKD